MSVAGVEEENTAISIGMLRRPSVVRPCSKIFFSKTGGPIEAKFHVEPPWVGEQNFVRGIWVT